MNRSGIFPFCFLFVLCAILLACTNPAAKLPNYGLVPAFGMTDSQGQPFHSKELNGKVWLVDFIYTHCPGPCPLMTSKMHKVEQKIKGKNDVQLVSISVDPARDTPPVLNRYAKEFGGPTKHWVFLTGTPATIHLLAYSTFHVGDVIEKMDHSTKFALVDKHGNIRGYYSPFDPDGMSSILKDMQALENS